MTCYFETLCLLLIFVKFGQTRDLWSEDLPQVSNVQLTKGQPIHLDEKSTRIQISGLNGTLYSDSLSQLHSVTELRIHRNQLRHVEKGALCSSPALKILDLEFYGNTKLPVLTRDAFFNCNNLEELLLKFDFFKFDSEVVDNPSIIHNNSFIDLSNLKKLAIQGHEVSYLTKDFLKIGHNSVTSLTLSFCRLEKIGEHVFDEFHQLEDLFIIHNNKLTRLPERGFKNLTKLKRLVLRDNSLKDLSWDEFQGLSSLKELVLMDNQISTLDAEKIARHMPNLETLHVEVNPVACKEKESFVKELKERLKHSVEVSFDPAYNDSCEQN